jgi:hypothetical protein
VISYFGWQKSDAFHEYAMAQLPSCKHTMTWERAECLPPLEPPTWSLTSGFWIAQQSAFLPAII